MKIRPLRACSLLINLALAGGWLSPPCSAAIVRVKYEGLINSVGSSMTDGFPIGESVWGEYFYDSQSSPIVGTKFQSEYAAIRCLSINTSGGFAGTVNYGVINTPPTVPILNQPLFFADAFRRDAYRVTNAAALVRVQSSGGLIPIASKNSALLAWSDAGKHGIRQLLATTVQTRTRIRDDIDSDGQFGPENFAGDSRNDFDDLRYPSSDGTRLRLAN